MNPYKAWFMFAAYIHALICDEELVTAQNANGY